MEGERAGVNGERAGVEGEMAGVKGERAGVEGEMAGVSCGGVSAMSNRSEWAAAQSSVDGLRRWPPSHGGACSDTRQQRERRCVRAALRRAREELSTCA